MREVEGEGQGGEWREMWSSMEINKKEKKKTKKRLVNRESTVAGDGN